MGRGFLRSAQKSQAKVLTCPFARLPGLLGQMRIVLARAPVNKCMNRTSGAMQRPKCARTAKSSQPMRMSRPQLLRPTHDCRGYSALRIKRHAMQWPKTGKVERQHEKKFNLLLLNPFFFMIKFACSLVRCPWELYKNGHYYICEPAHAGTDSNS